MPKIIIHAPSGTFDIDARWDVCSALTELALDCEHLPPSPFVRSTVWTYFNDYDPDAVFMDDSPATLIAVSVQIYVIKGGLDNAGKRRLIQGTTLIVGRYCATHTGLIPVYVVIHELPESNWGIFGENANLAALRSSAIDLPAL